MPPRITMADIAREAGVSASTVSRALSQHAGIPEATRQHIQAIAARHGYRIDGRARNFRLGRSQTVATLLPYQADSRRPFADPFYLAIVGAITDALDQYGYDSLLARVRIDDDDWTRRYVLDKRVDGLILIDRAIDDPGLRTLGALGANFVVWGAPVADQEYVSVGCDGAAGAHDAVRHLVRIGRRRIGFIGGFRHMVETDARRAGYEAGMTEAGLSPDPACLAFTDFTPEQAGAAVTTLLTAAPDLDALFVCSDHMAVGAIETLRQAGRRVPDDVSVVGYDDIPLAAYTAPPLTTVHQPIADGGRRMVQSLIAMIDGGAAQTAVLPHTLIVRGST